MFKRGAKVWIKGEQRGVYCDEIGEVAYRASLLPERRVRGGGSMKTPTDIDQLDIILDTATGPETTRRAA